MVGPSCLIFLGMIFSITKIGFGLAENSEYHNETGIQDYCPKLNDTSTANVTQPQGLIEPGDQANYTCNANLRFFRGDMTRVCLKNRTWSGQEPKCTKACK